MKIMSSQASEYPPVSLFKRLMAILYDSLLMTALLFIIGIMVASLFTFIFNDGNAITAEHPVYRIYQFVILVILFTTAFLFLGWFWTHGGQTLGMRTWKLKLISKDGSNVSWDQAFIRCFTALVSWGAFGLGFLWVLFNKEKKTWHDMASNTILIQLKKS